MSKKEKKPEENLVDETTEATQPEEISSELDYKEISQRLLAEQDNLRKRFEHDKLQYTKYALTGAVESLLPIVDNFYRATEHIPAEQKDSSWLTGIMYIQKQLLDCLQGWGVEEIPAKPGDVLDPNLHEAIGTVENADTPEDHIVTIQNRGYRLNGRVIRPVAVITSKNE